MTTIEDVTKLKNVGGKVMPTIEDVTKMLEGMDENTYSTAVRFIFFLMSDSEREKNERLNGQRRFIEETAGMIRVDEKAVRDLRMENMI